MYLRGEVHGSGTPPPPPIGPINTYINIFCSRASHLNVFGKLAGPLLEKFLFTALLMELDKNA